MSLDAIVALFSESIEVKQQLLKGSQLQVLDEMGEEAAQRIEQGGKLLFCGNGGSAADAQHLAAELLVRLRPLNNRAAVPALALAQDTSTITACGNDFGYEALFERLVRGLGRPEDILIAITTSGNSSNIVRALTAAREMGIRTFGFLGAGGGKALPLCDRAFVVPSDLTGRVQEAHITAGHALMEAIEDRLLERGYLTLGST
jgi:D-sedoheptulose 7-phosphate isomerase